MLYKLLLNLYNKTHFHSPRKLIYWTPLIVCKSYIRGQYLGHLQEATIILFRVSSDKRNFHRENLKDELRFLMQLQMSDQLPLYLIIDKPSPSVCIQLSLWFPPVSMDLEVGLGQYLFKML